LLMIIGLTGTIGSGKSTVSEHLKSLGALVLDADIISRQVVELGTTGLEQIIALFGGSVINPDGTLNRKAMAKLVFADEEKRLLLNSIIHPAVLNTLKDKTEAETEKNPNRVIVWDVPLLIEVGWNEFVDSVWLVTAPENVRIERIIRRDNCTAEQAEMRIRAQMSEDEKLKYSNNVIDNGSTLEKLYAQVDELYKRYTQGNV
jgi:dephospho-CoA kinase